MCPGCGLSGTRENGAGGLAGAAVFAATNASDLGSYATNYGGARLYSTPTASVDKLTVFYPGGFHAFATALASGWWWIRRRGCRSSGSGSILVSVSPWWVRRCTWAGLRTDLGFRAGPVLWVARWCGRGRRAGSSGLAGPALCCRSFQTPLRRFASNTYMGPLNAAPSRSMEPDRPVGQW